MLQLNSIEKLELFSVDVAFLVSDLYVLMHVSDVGL